MRPETLDEVIGQTHLLGNAEILRRIVKQKEPVSLILWGPPGTGKTTLARIIAREVEAEFVELSAVTSGKKDVEKVIEHARQNWNLQLRTVLFVDEIHRFNKNQQDALLPYVEDGTIVLIGATTENPSFEVNAALLSRCQVYVLKPLSPENLLHLTERILKTDFLFKNKKIELKETEGLIHLAQGDARKLCNIMELIGNLPDNSIDIDDELVYRLVQENPMLYDKDGEQHYDIASAFIKSIRGSDPNATLYWMARMIEGGENPRFIVRRMLISAAEDIGLANPNALLIAQACQQAIDMVGWPESRIILSEAAIYLACSPKSNSAYMAIERALETVRTTGNLPVPLHLRNAVTGLMSQLDYGKDYKYAHDFENQFVPLEYLPEGILSSSFYKPGSNTNEEKMEQFLRLRWKEKYKF